MITNLTQHQATPDQVAAEVTDLPADDRAQLQSLITFHEIPSKEELVQRAKAVADLAVKAGNATAMIGGAPYFMSVLEDALCEAGVKPVYAFSTRESQDVVQADGSIRKVTVFRHAGFVEVR